MPVTPWYPVGLVDHIQPGSSNPVILAEQELALWRTEDGTTHVWEDRCPHRGMRLSFGFVRGDVLRCIYHGWGYKPTGQCVVIPAHPDLTPPERICARTHPTHVTHGIIWTSLASEPDKPPSLPGRHEPWFSLRSIYINQDLHEIPAGIAAFFPECQIDTHQSLVTISTPEGAFLMLALQPVHAGKTGVHAVVSGPQADQLAYRLNRARQLAHLRDYLEATPATA